MLEPASIKGCFVEKSSGNTLEFATIIVKNKKDSIIGKVLPIKTVYLF
jgi:hypothetical protein